MNIENIVCNYNASLISCGIIHNSQIISWIKVSATYNEADRSILLSNYSSRSYLNHPDWKPMNLEILDHYMAVEVQSIGSSDIPKILLYDLLAS